MHGGFIPFYRHNDNCGIYIFILSHSLTCLTVQMYLHLYCKTLIWWALKACFLICVVFLSEWLKILCLSLFWIEISDIVPGICWSQSSILGRSQSLPWSGHLCCLWVQTFLTTGRISWNQPLPHFGGCKCHAGVCLPIVLPAVFNPSGLCCMRYSLNTLSLGAILLL